MRSFGIKVITVSVPKVYSAATLLFLAGSRRYVFKESVFLFHEPIIVNTGELGTVGHMEETIQSERLDSHMFKKVLEGELKTTRRFISSLADPDKPIFIKAEQALSINLATDLIERLSEIKL